MTLQSNQLSTLNESIVHLLNDNVKFHPTNKVMLIHDQDSPIAITLTTAFAEVITTYQQHEIIEFNPENTTSLKQTLTRLNKGDLVILIQTSNFRISEYRIRLECNNIGVFVLEFHHLDLIKSDQEQTFLNSLIYDLPRYNAITQKITPLINNSLKISIICEDQSTMVYTGPFDKVYYNIGEIHNTLGSLFPIGEFFTEPLELKNVNGTFQVYAFPSLEHETIIATPFHVHIKDGAIVSHTGPERFEQIIQLIKQENVNEQVPIREMGFGLNRFIGKQHPLGYVGSHERQRGFHVSIGLKHGIYRKKVPTSINQRYHIDMFINVQQIIVETPQETITIFENGEYIS